MSSLTADMSWWLRGRGLLVPCVGRAVVCVVPRPDARQEVMVCGRLVVCLLWKWHGDATVVDVDDVVGRVISVGKQ